MTVDPPVNGTRAKGSEQAQGFSPSPDDVRLMGEIAVSAAMRGRPEAAEPIFRCLAEIRSDRALGLVGLALCALARGNGEGALQLLKTCVEQRKRGSAQANGIMLFVLAACGQHMDAQRQAETMLAAGDPMVRQAARMFLDHQRGIAQPDQVSATADTLCPPSTRTGAPR